MNLNPFRDILIQGLSPRLMADKIFIHSMPSNINEGILLMAGIGGAKPDPYIMKKLDAKFQIIIRSKDYDAGYNLATTASNVLLDAKHKTQGNVFIHFVLPLHEPIPYALTNGGFTEFSVNLRTVYIYTTN